MRSDDQQYIYHIKPIDFKGKTIFCMNDLEDQFPNLYKKEMKKYKDRPNHLSTKIPLLDCDWSEVTNFSAVNPIKILEAVALVGAPGWKESDNTLIYRFNIKDIDNDFCLYDDDLGPKNTEAYSKLTSRSYKETQFIPLKTIKYFAKCAEEKEYPLLFGNIKHVLVRGNVSTSKAETILYKIHD